MISFWRRENTVYKSWLGSQCFTQLQEEAPTPATSRQFLNFFIFYWGKLDKAVLGLCPWTSILFSQRQSSWKVNQENEGWFKMWTTYGYGGPQKYKWLLTFGKMRWGHVRMGQWVSDTEVPSSTSWRRKWRAKCRKRGESGGGGAKRI